MIVILKSWTGLSPQCELLFFPSMCLFWFSPEENLNSFQTRNRLLRREIETNRSREFGGSGVSWKRSVGLFVVYPSVPFLLVVLTMVPSCSWPSFRGGILSFIRSRPRASSKLRIFLVGEKPWMAAGGRKMKWKSAEMVKWSVYLYMSSIVSNSSCM